VAHACNPSTQEAEAEGSQIQGQPILHSEFQVSLGYRVRHCLKINQKKTQNKIKYVRIWTVYAVLFLTYFHWLALVQTTDTE
jgi:hypothetical protein